MYLNHTLWNRYLAVDFCSLQRNKGRQKADFSWVSSLTTRLPKDLKNFSESSHCKGDFGQSVAGMGNQATVSCTPSLIFCGVRWGPCNSRPTITRSRSKKNMTTAASRNAEIRPFLQFKIQENYDPNAREIQTK